MVQSRQQADSRDTARAVPLRLETWMLTLVRDTDTADAIAARRKVGLSQSQFATLLGVSVRTLQGWEQGRKQPSGAARTLLTIAYSNPAAVLALIAE